MKILKAIGAFFARIWRWIKETAWIQPLLIVGAIFAVIFSIPYFSSWISSLGIGSENYYSVHKRSLEGELKEGEEGAREASQADKITKSIFENSNFKDRADFAYDETVAEYGYKYFLVFVKEDNSTATELQAAFETLEDGWNTKYAPSVSTVNGAAQTLPFRIYTIFVDEESSTDDNTNYDSESAFNRYLDVHADFFEDAGTRFEDLCPYKFNRSLDDTNYNYFLTASKENFVVPSIMLVDYTDEAKHLTRYGSTATGRVGASEILFSVTGDTKYDKADTLLKMWNHADDDKSNPFSSSYSTK